MATVKERVAARRAARARPHIPQRVEELTPEWFSETLGPNHGGARVVSVDATEIGAGIGFVGELQRCRLVWDETADHLPASVVVKVPTANPTNRALGEGLGGYQREIDVYSRLADQLGLPMPAFHHGVCDPDPAPWVGTASLWLFEKLPIGGVQWLTDRFLKLAEKSKRRYLLVIEDIADARPPSQVAGGTLDDAAVALEALAHFHARNWMTGVGNQVDNIWPIDRAPKVFQAGYRRNRALFVERFGSLVGDEMIARMDEVQERLPEMTASLTRAPYTLLHGDYRLDNILFRPDGQIVVLDYQLMGIGRPGSDVAYFITTALTPEHRGAEAELLRRYHETLVAAGVDDYSHDDLMADVTVTKELLAHRMIGTGEVLDTALANGDDSFMDVMVKRVIGWVETAPAV